MHGDLWVTPGREGADFPLHGSTSHLILFYKSTVPHFLRGTRSQVDKNIERKEKQGTTERFPPDLRNGAQHFSNTLVVNEGGVPS